MPIGILAQVPIGCSSSRACFWHRKSFSIEIVGGNWLPISTATVLEIEIYVLYIMLVYMQSVVFCWIL